jgi:hypothetical protein
LGSASFGKRMLSRMLSNVGAFLMIVYKASTRGLSNLLSASDASGSIESLGATIDVWELAVQHRLLDTSLKVDAGTALKDVYLLAQQSKHHSNLDCLTCFVVESGVLIGVVTAKEMRILHD